MRIMIVDNDAASADKLASMLRQDGHEAFLADELYCMEEIKTGGRVDMVITSIFLNATSGLQIVLDVKEYDPGIKVVAMSGGGPSMIFDYLDYAMEFGADAVVRKPMNEIGLTLLLKQLVGPPQAEPGGMAAGNS